LEQNLCLPVEKWLTSIRFAPLFVVYMQAMPISMPGINLTDSIALTKTNTNKYYQNTGKKKKKPNLSVKNACFIKLEVRR
jgi:hypothetical protein